MIGLVMAGGKGTRMNSEKEKLLLEYKKPLVLHVIDALKNSNCFEKIVAATSPNSPQTHQILSKENVYVLETTGKNFVTDLSNILIELDDIVFVVSGDMPLLDADIVKEIISKTNTEKTWTSVISTRSFQSSLGLNPEFLVSLNDEQYAHTGISVVNASKIQNLVMQEEDYLVIDDKRVCLNVNTKTDFELLGSS